jgi:uncharacterized damage-inducible protein DinB
VFYSSRTLSSRLAAVLSDEANGKAAVPRDLESIVVCMAKSRRGLLSAADAVSGEEWRTKPGEGRWSAAELVAHLVMVERAVVGKADRVAQKPPKRISLLKKIHLPMALVESRWIRRKAPRPVEPKMLRDKEVMLAELRTVRERSLAFLEETKSRDLSEYCWAHPALGTLNAYEWMQFIAAHEIRHTKQMREIAATLPKTVESLH